MKYFLCCIMLVSLSCFGQQECRLLWSVNEWGHEVGVIFGDSTAKDSIGTGFIISKPNLVMTCAHVVGNNTELYFAPIKSDMRYRVVLKKIDTTADLAILESGSDMTLLPPLQAAGSFTISSGDSICYICYNPKSNSVCMHFATILSCGKDTLINGIDRCMEYNGEVMPGNSGGPVLNQYGKVIGIVKGRITRPTLWSQDEFVKGCAFPIIPFQQYLAH
jgi:serine protease Do